MLNEKIMAITYSGIRDGEEQSIKELVLRCDLNADHLTTNELRNFILARKGGRIVGAVGLEITGNSGVVRSLCVMKNHRSQGIGKKLAVYIEKYAKSRGIEALYLLTLTAKDFFSKMGYSQINRNSVPKGIKKIPEFKNLCPDTAVCMLKQLK